MPKTKSGKPIPYEGGGMTDQMAEQMYMSEREAGGLMKKAKRINDADMMNMADGGMARIKGTPPAQVKGFTYNDNGGKGTFCCLLVQNIRLARTLKHTLMSKMAL